jgi:hypothetical protein
MPMVCTICSSKDRLQIDREIVEGKSYEAISRLHRVSSAAVSNHAGSHLSRQLTQSFAQRQAMENMNLLARIDKILSRAEQIFRRNFKAKHDHVALKALGESRCTIELLSKIAFALHQARADELAAQSGAYEARRNADEQAFIQMALDRLTPQEADLWARLLSKIHGQTDEPIVAGYTPVDLAPPNSSSYHQPSLTQDTRSRRTRFPKDKFKIRTVPPVPIPDGSDLPADEGNHFPDEARKVTVHRLD